MKSAVSLTTVTDYDRLRIEEAVTKLLKPLGGMSRFVQPGQKVLIKPNMLSANAPEKAVTTHPEIVRATILEVQKAGGTALVGDSPGVGSPRQVAKASGILQVIEKTGAIFAPFSDSVTVRPTGTTFHELEIAQDILDADVVINLPKLKTHQMMGLTCAVKNLFGTVVGMRKPRLHLQAGTDKAFFALMLLELAQYISPSLTIVDAVTAMEGNGPGSGDPIHLGTLLAGSSPLAVDTAATELVNMPQTSVWTQKIAMQQQLFSCSVDDLDLHGPALAEIKVSRFRPAKTTDVNFGLPSFLKNPLRTSLTALPHPDMDRCGLCGLCVRHCPPKVMQIKGSQLLIDKKRCIGCFCCQELCPQGAILTKQGLLLRLSRFLRKS